MRFLLDENLGKKIAYFLQELGHPTLRIREIAPGTDDYDVLNLAIANKAILITSDKDFGKLIFKEKQPHLGVILLRLEHETSDYKIKALKKVFSKSRELSKKFIVVTEKDGRFKIRVRK